MQCSLWTWLSITCVTTIHLKRPNWNRHMTAKLTSRISYLPSNGALSRDLISTFYLIYVCARGCSFSRLAKNCFFTVLLPCKQKERANKTNSFPASIYTTVTFIITTSTSVYHFPHNQLPKQIIRPIIFGKNKRSTTFC